MRANLNKENLIEVDVKNATVETVTGSMTFYATDENTCNIFCKLTTPEPNEEFLDLELMNHVAIDNAEDFDITMRMIDPDGNPLELAFTLLDSEDAIFYVDLTDEYLYYAGTYKCELFVDCIAKEKRERITTSPFSYEVKKSIWSELDNNLNGDPAQSVIDTLATMIYVDDSIAAIPETDLLHNFASISYVDESILRYDNEITKQDFASREYVLSAFDNIKYEIEKAGYTTESYVDKEIGKFSTSINSLLINDYATKSEMNTAINEALSNINLGSYATHTYVSNFFNAGINSRLEEYATTFYVGDKINELRKSMLNYSNIEAYMADYLWVNEYTTKDYVAEQIANAQLGGGEGGSVDLSDYATKEYVDGAIANIEIPEIEIPDLSGYATTEYVDGIITVIDKGDATGEITYDDFPDGQMPYKLNGTVYFTVDDKEYQMVFRNEIAYVDKRKVGFINLLRIWRTRIVVDATDGPDYLHINNGETTNYHFFATRSYVDNAIANIEVPDVDLTDYATKEELNTALGDIESLLKEI